MVAGNNRWGMIIDESAPSEAEESMYEQLAIHLSDLMSLVFETVLIRVDRKLMPHRRELLVAGLFPTREQAKSYFSEAELHELDFDDDESPRKHLSSSPPGTSEGTEPGKTAECIFELLGVYSPKAREIVIFDKMIRLMSARLGLDPHLLKKVVMAHETAHAVSHLGRDGKGIWFCFSCASRDEKELSAQIYPFLLFKSIGDDDALRCFLMLSDHQNDRYNSWRALKNATRKGVNARLMKSRSLVLDCSNAILDGSIPRPRNPSECPSFSWQWYDPNPVPEVVVDLSKPDITEDEERIIELETMFESYMRHHPDAPKDYMTISIVMGLSNEYYALLEKFGQL